MPQQGINPILQKLTDERAASSEAERNQVQALTEELAQAKAWAEELERDVFRWQTELASFNQLQAQLAAAEQQLLESRQETGTVEVRVQRLLADRMQELDFRAEQLDLQGQKLDLRAAQLERTVRHQVEKELHEQVAGLIAEVATLEERAAAAATALAAARLEVAQQERDRFDQELQRLEAAYQEREAGAATREAELRARLDEGRDDMARERGAFQQREAALQQQRRALEAEQGRLEQQKAELEMQAAGLDATRVFQLEFDLRVATQRVEYLEQELERVAQDREELNRRLHARSGGDADALQVALDRLRADYNAALDRMAQLEPRAAEQELLRERARMADEMVDRVAKLETQNLKYQAELGKALVKATEADLHAARAEDYHLRLREEIRHREADVAARKQLVTNRFAEFQSVWEDPTLQEVPQTESWDLKSLVETARFRLYEQGFAYPAHVIQNFTAALATARLVILAGLSGTGKTSLPVMMAKSFGFGYRIVPVEPRWRDKSDLFGWSNPMDGSFAATEFAKALVEAATPRYRHLPYFIILDEMNLAHVEYYFAEIHSSRFIEMEEPTHRVKLVDVGKMEGVSLPFLENGFLQIPENVWFIGTINQDHTVKEISDRVYDRAQVIQFERWTGITPPPEVVMPANAPHCRSLLQRRPGSSDQVATFLEEVRTGMENDLFTNFGPRVAQSFGRYLPAFEAAGGLSSDGLDLQLCAKLMPKIELAGHRLSPERLISFRSRLSAAWQKLALKGVPEHFTRALQRLEEARR